MVQQQGDASPGESRVPRAGWQSALGRSPEAACPLLGLRMDPDSHFSMPVDEHRCQAGRKPAEIDTGRQREVCLSGAFATCERLLARPDAAEIMASVRPAGSRGPGTPSTGSLAGAAAASSGSSGPESAWGPVAGGPPSSASASSSGSGAPTPSSAAATSSGSSGPASAPASDGWRSSRMLPTIVLVIVAAVILGLVVLFVTGIVGTPVVAGGS